MKTSLMILIAVLLCAPAAGAARAADRNSSAVTLSASRAQQAGEGVRVWTLGALPSTAVRVLEAKLEIDMTVTRPTLVSLVAAGEDTAPYASTIVVPESGRVSLDATRLMRDRSGGDSRATLLVTRPAEAGNDRHRGDVATDETVDAARLRVVETPSHYSRVRDALSDRRRSTLAEESTTPGLPDRFGVKAWPNPFNPVTTIQLALPTAVDVDVAIYNVRGQLIKTLQRGDMPAGFHNLKWRGHNNGGDPVASGVYFYRAQLGRQLMTGKLTLLK